jgi:hypothetical protein
MTTTEMKDILASKLKSEGTYFTKSDISIRSIKNGYRIVIKDYEHIPFTIYMEEDDYFGYCVFIRGTQDEWDDLVFSHSKHGYPLENALVNLGYYIGTRF